MLKLYAVRDVKADTFNSLIVLPTKGLAMRGLVDAVSDERSPLRLHPEDYTLYELGTFEESSGEVKGYPSPVYIMSAIEALAMGPKKEDFQLRLPGIEQNGRLAEVQK